MCIRDRILGELDLKPSFRKLLILQHLASPDPQTYLDCNTPTKTFYKMLLNIKEQRLRFKKLSK